MHVREMRTIFDCETTKAIAENHTGQNVNENVVDDCNDNEDSEADTVNGSDDGGNNSDNNDNDIDVNDNENVTTSLDNLSSKRKRAINGQKQINKNRYRRCISSRSRKVRTDTITGEEIQRFCHESQWGGRIDTSKLLKQSVIVDQPGVVASTSQYALISTPLTKCTLILKNLSMGEDKEISMEEEIYL